MNAHDKAQRECGKLQEKRDKLQGRLAAVEADLLTGANAVAHLEQQAFGQELADAEIDLEKTEAAIAKNMARKRGIAAEIVAVTEELNAALDVLRKVTLAAEVEEHRRLSAKRGPVAAELAAIDGRMAAIARGWEGWQSADAQAEHAAEEELKTATERYAGCTIRRTITSEEVPSAYRG